MNKSPSHHSADETRRLRESAEWLIRLSGDALDGEALSDEELAAWIQWYEMDAVNAQAFEEMQTLWANLGQIQPAGLTARHLSTRKSAPASAGHREVGTSGVARKLVASLTASGISHRKTFAWSSLLAAGALSAWAVVASLIGPAPLELPPNGAMGTMLAENQEAVLPDGSIVALGAQSSLALEYEPKARRLKLTNGQAYFKVAKDKTRPFAVDTGDIKIQAVGTAFDVRKNDGRVAVTVTEGIVDIIADSPPHETSGAAGETNHSTPIRVAAGYQLIWDKGSADDEHNDGRKKIVQLSQVDTAGMTAWREGRLEYVNEPLSVVIANVNRYSSRRLIIESTDLGAFNFTGTILVDSIDDWLTAIQLSFPVKVREGQDGSLIIRRRFDGATPAVATPVPSITRAGTIRHFDIAD